MTCSSNSASTDSIRGRVRTILECFGVPSDAAMHETILIRGGFYCGRRFLCDGMQVVWFIEENQLKVFGRGGELNEVRAAVEERLVLTPAA